MSMKRLTRVRWYTVEPPASKPQPPPLYIDEKIVKPFDQIHKEMSEKTTFYRENLWTKTSNRSISKIDLKYHQMSQQFTRGDAIMIGSSVFAIVEMPRNFVDPIIVCDAKGVTRQVYPAMVTARLCNLIPSASKLFADCFDGPDKSAVSGSFYRHVGYALGSLQNDAMDLARKLVPIVVDLLLLCQTPDRPVTTSLYDFMSLVQRYRNYDLNTIEKIILPLVPDEFQPNFTPDFIVAMRMIFDDYLVRNKIRLEFGYTKRNALIINSVKDEQRFVDMTSKNTTYRHEHRVPVAFVKYVKDYALDNLSTTNPQSDGIALQILRHTKSHANDFLTKSDALSWAHLFKIINLEGPFMDRFAYKWFIDSENKCSQLSNIVSLRHDKLKSHRIMVNEPVYCIDSDDTTEVDDGISLVVKDNVATVSVHIANPTSAFEDPAPLVNAVYDRSTTVYMPQGKIPMLPDEFAANYSLADGSPALSVVMDFDLKTGKRLDTRIQASTLKHVERVNYEQVEELLNGGSTSPFHQLYQLSGLFKGIRVANNAVPELVVQGNLKVYTDGSAVKVEKPATERATQLVTEMMLMANSAVADYTWTQQIPCIYRYNSLAFHNEQQKIDFYNQKKIGFDWMPALRPSAESTTPQTHTATGLAMYTWFTSPLRRAQDLLLHFQLEAHILNKPVPLSAKKLENMIPWITTAQALVKKFQKQMNRYYILKYLEPLKNTSVSGYLAVTREDGTQQIYLDEYGIYADLHSAKPLTGHGPHTFMIKSINAVADLLAVRKFTNKL